MINKFLLFLIKNKDFDYSTYMRRDYPVDCNADVKHMQLGFVIDYLIDNADLKTKFKTIINLSFFDVYENLSYFDSLLLRLKDYQIINYLDVVDKYYRERGK